MERQISDEAKMITEQLKQLSACGGRVQLSNASHHIRSAVVLDSSSTCLAGEVWACNTDPNGVFETQHGTKLRMHGRDFPAIMVGANAGVISGAVVRDLGVQGDISGMDVRGILRPDAPACAAGLCLQSVRTDQCEFSKLSFCGCSSAVCAAGEAEIDACIFEKLNTDGCGNGFYFAPRASYYARVRSCIMADNPYYGFYAVGKQRQIHNLQITDCHFVRSGGAFSEEDGCIPAALLFDEISRCEVDHCLFDAPGTYWHYAQNATKNSERQIHCRKTVAMYVKGNQNRLTNNIFLNSSDDAVRIEGDENVLMSTISDGSVRICGRGNAVVNLVFTKPDARLILQGGAADTTTVIGVPQTRIVYVE